ncbi:MAG: Piwi domain-containing protein [Kofleriaceae bacterium]|nr:Piwi domain-containing protein [Kofleriaceae bacterium]
MAALRTNFFLVDVEDATVDVGTITPYDEERRNALEVAHGTHYAFKRRGDALDVVMLAPDAPPLEGVSFEQRSVRRLGKLINVLVERGIEKHLASSKVSFVRRRPLKLVSLEPKNDIAHGLFGVQTQGRLPLHVRRGFSLEARTVYRKQGPRTALVIDGITHADLDGTCADLINDDFDLRGLYVFSLEQADLKHGRPTLVGQVQRVDGSTVHLGGDRRGDRVQYDASSLALELGPMALPRLAAHYAGPTAHEALWDEKNNLATGSQRWERITGFAEHVGRASFEIAPGVRARLSGSVAAADLGQTSAALPRYVVGGGRFGGKTASVFASGPHHVPPSASKGVRACIICERSRRTEVETFLKALTDGHAAHRALKQTWKIGDLTVTRFEAEGPTAADYEKACRAAIDEGSAWQLALVQVPSGTSELVGDQNPYLITKAKFLSRNVPVQEFRVETMQKPKDQLQWALGGIGLQVFAKLGGVPWLLQTTSKEHELVLGLGSANLGTGKFGDRERVVGLTTAFSGDGRYWLTETSKTVKFEEHEDAVIDSAVSAFKRVRTDMAWRAGDPVRVVIHSFKDFRDKHVEALKKAVLDVAGSEFKVDFAFVHIVEKHPLLLFDPGEKQRVPPRGVVVRLGNSEALVTVQGPTEVRREFSGFPRPVCVKIHRSSTFTDIEYLSWQALAFSALSWRNFPPTTAPVTVQYAKWIADLLGRLGTVSKWDPDVLRGGAGTSRWFL